MMKQAVWAAGFCGLLSVSCSGTSGGHGAGQTSSGTDVGANTLAGTWDLQTTPMGEGPVATTVTIGQDSLLVTSPGFTVTATRTGNALAFTDEQDPGEPEQNVTLTATQTAAAFDAGVLPFDLSGSWTMQIVPAGQTAVMACTLTVSATEIDGACQMIASDGFDFTFTTTKTASAASLFGDFGGTWNNTWIWPGSGGGTYPCALDFSGSSITTCAGGAVDGENNGNPISGISFTYDGANTASGAAQGWAEFSATRQ
jgi:hypothetical protein